MRLKFSGSFRALRAQGSPTKQLLTGERSKPFKKQPAAQEKFALVSKFDEIDLNFLPIQRKRKIVRVSKIQNDFIGCSGIRRKRPFWRKRISILRETVLPNDLDRISQWSVPLIIPDEDDSEMLEENLLRLVRSQSQQNFLRWEEPLLVYNHEEFDESNFPQRDEITKEEPHLNYYVMNGQTKEGYEASNSRQIGTNLDSDCIRYEDNLFDSLCQSGRVCSDNPDNDLLFCAEIQRSDIMNKAYSVFTEYYGFLDTEPETDEAASKWEELTQEERLPFLLQAYISDYMRLSS